MIRNYKQWSPQIAQDVYIDSTAIVLGQVSVATGVGIYPYAVLRGDDQAIEIGKHSNIQDHVVIHQSGNIPTKVGEGVSVGHGAILHGCTVHDHVLIGIHATLLDGVVINEFSIVAAGSVCPPNKEYPAYSMIMGAPAKVTRTLTHEEIESISSNAAHYVALSQEYQKE